MTSGSKVVLIAVNPKAGRRSRETEIAAVQQGLLAAGYAVELHSQIEQLSARAADALAAGHLQAVVAAGGDGTVSLVVNKTPPATPIAIFPLGTENLLAKYAGQGTSPDEVMRTITEGERCVLDVGSAGGRYFLLMVSCGFDADVVRRLHEERSGHIRHLSYGKPIFEAILNYDYPEVRVHCRGAGQSEFQSAISARWVFVANLPRYAAGLAITPQASGTDGLLDVCTFREGSLWNGLRYLSAVLWGQHQQMEECVTQRAAAIRLESEARVPYQLDGDAGGYLPLEIEVVPRRLTLLVPPGRSGIAAEEAAATPEKE